MNCQVLQTSSRSYREESNSDNSIKSLKILKDNKCHTHNERGTNEAYITVRHGEVCTYYPEFVGQTITLNVQSLIKTLQLKA